MGWKFAFVMVLAGSALAQTPDVSLRAETASGRTQFRMGEAIGIKLTLESTSGGSWQVFSTGPDRALFERREFRVSPRQGTSDPLGFRAGEGAAVSQLGGIATLDKPWSENADLNQWVRFDRAGPYRVSALVHVSGKQGQNLAVSSNEIEIEIIPAEKEWLAEQLRQAVAVLDGPARTDPQAFYSRMTAARTIWYLDTPESVREAARLLGTVDEQTARPLQSALRGSAHQDVAVAAMRQLMRSPDQAVTPVAIQTLARMESPATEQQLRGELADTVARKQGEAKAISLDTLVSGTQVEAVTENLRAQLAAVFSDLPWQQQRQLLSGQWQKIAGPAMVPVLRRISENPTNGGLQALAVRRLYELDPARGRALILDDMKRDTPELPYETLAMLPDATLPGMDAVLLERLQHGGGTELIARYATANILDGVKDWYAKEDAALRARKSSLPIYSGLCAPPLVAYFLRVDPAWGERVLREALNDRGEYSRGCWAGIVGRTARYQAGPAWEKVAIEALTDPVVAVKSDAVKALGDYGSEAARPAVMNAFRFFHDWWKDKPADKFSEGPFELAFLQATVRAQNWVADGEELEKIRDLCITANCRSQAAQYLPVWRDSVPVSIGVSDGGDVSVMLAQYNARSLDAARVRLLQLPAGTRVKWNPHMAHTPEIDAWVAAIDGDLAGRGVSITP